MRIPDETDFWSELDEDILRCLAERHGRMTPTELGARLGMSESAVSSVIAMLAETGKVRITSVERVM
ncbi:MAG TPA: winged helix-turn-helix transcriptional regulator [Methylomirabilota bacterium]|nr:winged helix-turn-helix transcriptional regulator [Methylomirabilota bacterium]